MRVFNDGFGASEPSPSGNLARAVVKSLTGNADFPNLPVDLTAFRSLDYGPNSGQLALGALGYSDWSTTETIICV